MKRSSGRTLTTHCGSLPRPTDLVQGLAERDLRQPHDEAALAERISRATSEIARRQVDLGIDVINDGEHSKTSFSSYAALRLGGMVPTDEAFGFSGRSRDMLEF